MEVGWGGLVVREGANGGGGLERKGEGGGFAGGVEDSRLED